MGSGECIDCAASHAIFTVSTILLVLSAIVGFTLGKRLLYAAKQYDKLDLAQKRMVGSGLAETGEREHSLNNSLNTGELDRTIKFPWEVEFSELKLQTCLAKGSSGQVFKGTWLGTVVAIKIPHRHLSELMKDKFIEEALLMSKLHHPNIVMFLAACLDPVNLALVLEYLPRGSLHDFLKDKSNKISLGLAHRFAVDICRGMRYLHTRCSIIQRDLKPRNLLIDDALNVKVCDFGLSRAIEEKDANVMTACGTPYWTAPEVVKNQGYNEKADVYSFGIILFELVTREDPFGGLPGLEVAVKAAHAGLRPKIPSFCPDSYRELMEVCWQEDQTSRPSFYEILERLSKIKKQQNDAEVPGEEKGNNTDDLNEKVDRKRVAKKP